MYIRKGVISERTLSLYFGIVGKLCTFTYMVCDLRLLRLRRL